MSTQKDKILVVIGGPTAVGKTDLAIDLAQHFKTEIISADSRQIFKEMQIGTAKPTADEMKGIIHHFIDSHSIHEEYNAGKFENDVLALLEQLFSRYQIVIMVGGSGMYIQAVTEGFDELPVGDSEVRKKLQLLKDERGLTALQEKLKLEDPDYFKEVDLNNPQRIMRALEVIEITGKPFSKFRLKKRKARQFRIIKIGMQQERSLLYSRIDQRMDHMLEIGLLDEAKELYQYKQNNALQTVGYKEIFDFLEGYHDWKTTVELLKRNSRRYAKRQLTWFHRDPQFNWFLPEQKNEIIAFLEKEINSKMLL